MKKGLKITLLILVAILIVFLSFLVYVMAVTATASIDQTKLINLNRSVCYYDYNGNQIDESKANNDITTIDKIPKHVIDAFISIEDKRFYQHHGVDYRGLFRATFNNFKSFSFKEGASTISQQLIKNTHLSNEKTLSRKFVEMKLAKDLEKMYTKDEIMEKYLNTIYFGDQCFGITKASIHYFNKLPSELTIAEGASLAGLIKAPSNYSPTNNYEKCNERKNVVLTEMYNQGYITQIDYEIAKNQVVISENNSVTNTKNCIDLIKSETNELIEKNLNRTENFSVYTYFDSEIQKALEDNLINYVDNYSVKAIMIDKNSNIVAYFANCRDYRRQIGSVIKPLLCYAPAIENNVVDSFSIINDEKTDFEGYKPSNYRDYYYGNISVKASLTKSSNVCAVKLLNYVGIDKAKSYLSRTSIPITEDDNSLVIALGNTVNGATIKEICESYSVFLNDGEFISSSSYNLVTDNTGKTINKAEKTTKKVFGDDTVCLINDMLNETAKTGTAKRLSTAIDLCAKTGTVGTKDGNTDAYCISYNKDYCLCVWLGSKTDELLSNSITGGSFPTEMAKNIWNQIYSTRPNVEAFTIPDSVEKVNLDKISYSNLSIELADEITPKRYVKEVWCAKDRIPTVRSNRFSSPELTNAKISKKNNEILIQLCLTEYYNAKVFKSQNGKKTAILDTKHLNDKSLIKDTITSSGEYEYSVIPYYFDGEKEHLGKEIYFPKIKVYDYSINENWWDKEFN